jgi:hypothetical protein
MFLGGRVDDALSTYYRQLLEHAQTLSLDQVHDAYRDHWTRELAAEQAKRGIAWDAELDEPRAFGVGLDALALTLSELVPRIGRPVAVQRRLEYALAAELEWNIQGYLDLETLRPAEDGGDPVAAIVDYKVKGTPHSQAKADDDPQASLYLASRWLAGDPAHEFSFAQIGKPGPRRKQMSASFVTTRRSIGQLRAMLARIAQAASQIAAAYERLGPDQPWVSPTRPAGSAARATAATTASAPAGAGFDDSLRAQAPCRSR